MKSLELCGVQRLSEAPIVNGATRLCRNLAEGPDGTLVPTKRPATVASLPSPPVACDRQSDRTVIFTQRDDGALLLSCSLSDSNEADLTEQLIAELHEKIVQGESCGNFLVLRGESGTLYYLRRDAGYKWLGTLPEAPLFSTDCSETATFSAEVAEVAFKGTPDDLRSGLDAENAERVNTALEQALAEALEEAARGGCRTTPVVVRVAWRLWDGNLLHISEPQVVSGVGEVPGTARVMLSLTSSTSGFTGTERGTLSVKGYKLKVNVLNPLPQGWEEVVKGAEVWVSEQPGVLRDGESASISAVTSGSTQRLACTLPVKTISSLGAEALACPMAPFLTVSTWSGTLTIPTAALDLYRADMTATLTPEENSSLPDTCDALLGYGGFLHIAKGEAVHSSVRGNPFVAGSSTPSVGAPVSGIYPQLRGGGAYTRQYLYLTTERGMVALTHDRDGQHTNCRFVWPVSVSTPRCVLPTGAGLYVSGSRGELLLVRDAGVRELLSGAKGVRSIARSSALGRLHVCADAQSLVLQEKSDGRAYMADFVCNPLAGCMWRALGWYEHRLGQVSLYDLDETASGVSATNCLLRLLVKQPTHLPAGRLLRMYLPVSGSAVMATVVVRAGSTRSMREISRMTINGELSRGVSLPLTLVANPGEPPLYYEVNVAGSFEQLSSPTFIN